MMIIFVHVERTAGSSVHAWFNPANTPELNGRYFIVSGDAALAEMPPVNGGLFYLGGHFSIAEVDKLGLGRSPDDILFSITRDPAERAASLYSLMKRSPEWLPHIAPHVGDRGLEYFYDFCLERGWYFPNSQCVRLSGSQSAAEALNLVRNRFAFLGSSDHFDATAEILQRLVRRWIPNFAAPRHRLNQAMTSGQRPLEDLASLSLIARIRRENAEDEALHRSVLEAGGLIVGERFKELS